MYFKNFLKEENNVNIEKEDINSSSSYEKIVNSVSLTIEKLIKPVIVNTLQNYLQTNLQPVLQKTILDTLNSILKSQNVVSQQQNVVSPRQVNIKRNIPSSQQQINLKQESVEEEEFLRKAISNL